MAKRTNSFPLRIVLIAGVIIVALGTMLVALNRLGRPAEDPPSLENVDPAEDLVAEPAPLLPPIDVARPIMTIQLFVADVTGRQLVTHIQRVDEPPTPAGQVSMALEQLAAAAGSPMPPDTVIREIWVANGIAYLDFSADLPAQLDGGSRAELMFVYGIVGTLTSSVPTVSAVQFLVDGQPVDTLTGHTSLADPVEPLSDWSF
jgi:germination protein M